MRHDIPAALPLIGLVAGLAIGPVLVNRIIFAIGIALIAMLVRKAIPAFLLFIAGIAMSIPHPPPVFPDEAFTIVEAPIERDWASRDGYFVLRASRFCANGTDIDAPVAIYIRESPPPIARESTIRVEGFVRLNERGEHTVSVKSLTLMSYGGRMQWWHPATWNRLLAQRLERHAQRHPDEVALAQALVLGRGERLSREVRNSFRRGGTYHLLVFSGLQIAFAAGMIAALLRWLHRPRASDWLLFAFAILAPPFIGPTASVARASTGIGLYALSRLLKRPTSIENLWCVAAIARLLIEPRDLGDAAFHLTYAGAGALLFIGKHFRRWTGHVVAAEIVLTPLTLLHFHRYALGGSLLTLLISPLIFAMLIASTLAIAIPCDAFFLTIRVLHRLCTFANAFGFSGVFASPPLASLIAAAGLALVALAALRERTRAIAIAIAMLIPSAAALVKHAMLRTVEHPRITFLDVGQGDAIAIRNGAHTILVDGGRDERILELLADRGVRRFDAVILTHAHPDHCTGLAHVIAHFHVRTVWLSPRRFQGDCAQLILDACAESQTPIHLVRDRDRLALDGVAIEANVGDRTFRRSAENNASIVLRVAAGERRFLLTGDIEREAELDFADRDLRADVLKVPHHGSRSSSSDSLLDNVGPRIAIISCGRRNLFGHPHESVLDALRERRIRVWRTDRDGSIDVDVRERRLYVRPRID